MSCFYMLLQLRSHECFVHLCELRGLTPVQLYRSVTVKKLLSKAHDQVMQENPGIPLRSAVEDALEIEANQDRKISYRNYLDFSEGSSTHVGAKEIVGDLESMYRMPRKMSLVNLQTATGARNATLRQSLAAKGPRTHRLAVTTGLFLSCILNSICRCVQVIVPFRDASKELLRFVPEISKYIASQVRGRLFLSFPPRFCSYFVPYFNRSAVHLPYCLLFRDIS